MNRKQVGVLAGVAVVAAAGLGAGMGIAATGSPTRPAASASAPAGPGYSWYRSMMGRYNGGTMMGGTSGPPMMSIGGYQWMMGGAQAPGWMHGGRLPTSMMGMMGAGADPGKIMGRLWADAPGQRVSADEAARAGSQIPAGATVNRAAGTITFTTTSVRLVALADPAGGPDERFRIAGMVNPAISVPAGSQVSIEVINADHDTAHGLVVTAGGAGSSWMPMMTDSPSFPGAALWFLGSPAPAGMHAGTFTFTASTPGIYRYLCPVPGHAQEGMTGTFAVRAAG